MSRRTNKLREAGVLLTTLPRSDGGLDLGAAMRWLGEHGVNTVLSEAGHASPARWCEAGLADRLMIITAPIAGGEGPPALAGVTDTSELKNIARATIRRRRRDRRRSLGMFTGIVEELGTVRHVELDGVRVARLEIACARVLERLSVDDSVNVGGACLTVIERDDRGFACDVVPEMLARTTLGGLMRGSRVNLERAATPETALGGHLVRGHVDGTTKLVARRAEGEGARLRFALPKTTARYVVMKGFITVDGVSLTSRDREDVLRGRAHPPHRRAHDAWRATRGRGGQLRGRHRREVRGAFAAKVVT